MKSRLTIAGRINLYVMVLAFTSTLALAGHAIYRTYQDHLSTLIQSVESQTRQGIKHPVAFYFRDEALFAGLLADLARHDAVLRTAAYDLEGVQLAEFLVGDPYPNTDFLALRKGTGQLSTGLNEPPWLPASSDFIDITVPVFSALNPLERGLDRAEFGLRMADVGAASSYFLTGYYHVGISRRALFTDLIPEVQDIAMVAGAALIAIILLTALFTRRIRVSLAR